MTTIVKVFNPDLVFWEVNPSFKMIEVFNTFYEKDKTKKKEYSSRIMWAIAHIVDPNNANPYRNYSEKERMELITKDYLREPEFNWELPEYKLLLKTYEDCCITIAEKEKVRFERKLVDRGNFLDATSYTLDTYNEDTGKVVKGTADQLDKMLLNTSKLYEQLSEINNKLKQEEAEGYLRAGQKKSASEKGQI